MAKKRLGTGNKQMLKGQFWIVALGLLPLLFFPSCATQKRLESMESQLAADREVIEKKSREIGQLEEEKATLNHKLFEQKQLSKKLQTTLLMRHKETDACRQANEKLTRELLNSKAKLATRGSRLEAATLVAEATAVISTVEKQALNDAQQRGCKIAVQEVAKSRLALAEGDFQTASFLAGKALARAKGIGAGKNVFTNGLPPKEILFSTPLDMALFITGNFRNAPSMTSDIKRVLPEGTRVTAIGFQRNWVKVKLPETGETGWIHLSLLY